MEGEKELRILTVTITFTDYNFQGQSNVFSMCDVNNCNSGQMVQFTVMSLLLSLLPMTLM